MSESIFDFTGNPFVDAGIWAISQWVGKKPKELDKDDLEKASEEIFDMVYSNEKWFRSILHGMVFPNGKVSNPGDFKKPLEERKKKAIEYYNKLIEEIEPLNSSGSCIACGRRNIKNRYFKSEMPLTGSGAMLNYFSYGTKGADYCSACAFAVHFSPLIMYKCGDLLLLHSNSEFLMKTWSRKAVDDLKTQWGLKSIKGCFNEGYKNTKNALFHIVGIIIMNIEGRGISLDQISLTFYRFKNFNQGANLDIYYFPTPVFRFLTYINQDEKADDWKRIVRKGYAYVDCEKVKEEDEYKNRQNTVYNNLLDNKSIIGFFIDKNNKEAIGGWDLISQYLKEVKNMDENRVEAIKDVGDRLASYIKQTEDFKSLEKLENATRYDTLRNILRIIIKKRIKNGEKEPLFSFDEYVTYLFPESSSGWKETQDLLLFRIYEILNEWMATEEISKDLTINEEIEMGEENV